MSTAAGAPQLSEEELMRRVQFDDASAFEELYDRLCAKAFGLAMELCDTPERAEEAVQDAFLNLWRARAHYDETRGRVQTWLLALIRNRSIDIHRRHHRHDTRRAQETYLDLLAAGDCVERDTIAREEANNIRGSLQQLPARQREVILLSYFGGLTHTEIADRLALPVGTVKSRMRAGLRATRDELEGAA